MSTFNEHLLWRYATKKFDPAKKLSDQQLKDLLEAIRLAPTSYGLQPYRVLVVKDPAIRAALREKAWGQSQVTDASELIVFCALKTIGEAYVDEYVGHVVKERGTTPEALKGYRDMMGSFIQGMPAETLAEWMKKQTYIALGVGLSAAASMKIDSCPMEGFDKNAFDEILGLADKNLASIVLMPVGFRASDDATAQMKKARFPMDQLVTVIG